MMKKYAQFRTSNVCLLQKPCKVLPLCLNSLKFLMSEHSFLKKGPQLKKKFLEKDKKGQQYFQGGTRAPLAPPHPFAPLLKSKPVYSCFQLFQYSCKTNNFQNYFHCLILFLLFLVRNVTMIQLISCDLQSLWSSLELICIMVSQLNRTSKKGFKTLSHCD